MLKDCKLPIKKAHLFEKKLHFSQIQPFFLVLPIHTYNNILNAKFVQMVFGDIQMTLNPSNLPALFCRPNERVIILISAKALVQLDCWHIK